MLAEGSERGGGPGVSTRMQWRAGTHDTIFLRNGDILVAEWLPIGRLTLLRRTYLSPRAKTIADLDAGLVIGTG